MSIIPFILGEIMETKAVYHYTQANRWNEISDNRLPFEPDFFRYLDDIFHIGHMPGLWPINNPLPQDLHTFNLLKQSESDIGMLALFALLEPEPETWVKNPEHPNVWKDLMNNTCFYRNGMFRNDEGALIKINLAAEDEVYVLDFAQARRVLDAYKPTKGIMGYARDENGKLNWKAFRHELADPFLERLTGFPPMWCRAKAYQAYWDSKVPLADYDGSYELPEVIICNPIPKSRLELVWTKSRQEVMSGIESRVYAPQGNLQSGSHQVSL